MIWVPLAAANGFRPDLDSIDPSAADKAKIMFVNYPNNPTSAVADASFLERLVAFAHKHRIVILADNAYLRYTSTKPTNPVAYSRLRAPKIQPSR